MINYNMQEVGFIYLHATILGSGILDDIVDDTVNYACEKSRVNALLHARYDIENVECESRDIIGKLIKNELGRWWQDSRYNTMIIDIAKKIIEIMRIKLIDKCTIIASSAYVFTVTGLSYTDFLMIQSDIRTKYRGLIAFYSMKFD